MDHIKDYLALVDINLNIFEATISGISPPNAQI
jgi:hypothetical protein